MIPSLRPTLHLLTVALHAMINSAHPQTAHHAREKDPEHNHIPALDPLASPLKEIQKHPDEEEKEGA